MAIHKYKIGQLVRFSPGRTSMSATAREYKITALLPPENGQNQYRIKAVSETFERVAQEHDLARR
ncbi:MAG: hypothetical protein AB7O57_13940 [Hyphomicrobiaceae bacterium]